MLRPAEERDVDIMRLWRNHPANREVSIFRHEIGKEEHRAWWSRVQDDPAKRVLVFEYDDRPLGVVSFFDLAGDGATDGAPDSGSWGFYLDHETVQAEGTAMLVWMRVMKEAIAYAFVDLGLDVLHGEVLADNEAVRSMNRRFRFAEGEPEEREVDGRTITVVPISLRRQDARLRRPG